MTKRSGKSSDALYKHILVPLENSRYDLTILDHIRPLARLMGSHVTIIHVADGFMARNIDRFPDSPEIQDDTKYMEQCRDKLNADDFDVDAVLEFGDPAQKILEYAGKNGCDLIAMATHGHRGVVDVILGSVANSIRHSTEIPVLLVKAPKKT
ncbi:MAG: universal stress protein [Candidatus Sumerlaeota bacterium]